MQREYLKRLADKVLLASDATSTATDRNMVREVRLTVWRYRFAGVNRCESAILPTNDPSVARCYLFGLTGCRVVEVTPHRQLVEE